MGHRFVQRGLDLGGDGLGSSANPRGATFESQDRSDPGSGLDLSQGALVVLGPFSPIGGSGPFCFELALKVGNVAFAGLTGLVTAGTRFGGAHRASTIVRYRSSVRFTEVLIES